MTRIFLLVDGSCSLTAADQIGIEMLEEFGKPYTVSSKTKNFYC